MPSREGIVRAAPGAIRAVGRIVDVALLLIAVASIARLGLAVDPAYEALAFTKGLDAILGPTWSAVRGLLGRAGLPRTIRGVEAAPIVLAVAVFILRNALNWRLDRLALTAARRQAAAAMAAQSRARRDGAAEDDTARLAATRRVAVATYTEARATLEATKMELTFLSLDVVGSTKMKQGEDPYVIEQAFTDYRRLVEGALRRHEAYKQTWTPDGQMAAFKSAPDAVACAKEILSALPRFNAETSKMRTPFSLRVGANCGVVSTDDATPMEKISDFSIDVAGHMQKHAEPDTLWISGEILERLPDTAGFAPAGREVDGHAVHAWAPRGG